MKKFAVILCGCGTLDGSEIHESVMTLLAIDRNGGEYQIFAPNDWQYHVVNHVTGEPMFPGGNGSAKNLFTYALEGASCSVREDVAKVIRAFHNAGKPVGALCIAPVMIAKVLGDVTITVGSDPGTIRNVESFGTKHEVTVQKGVCADKANKVFTTPCYMLPARIGDIADCADNLVKAMLSAISY